MRGKQQMLPLYEAKMIHHYDNRWATFEPDGSAHEVTTEAKIEEDSVAIPRYWVDKREVDERLQGRWDRKSLLGFPKHCAKYGRSNPDCVKSFHGQPSDTACHWLPLMTTPLCRSIYIFRSRLCT